MTDRNSVLEGRINVAVLDANEVVAGLAALVATPPIANSTTEDRMRMIESSLNNIKWCIEELRRAK